MSEHKPHPHHPMNVNALVQLEHLGAGFNRRIALTLTRAVGTMTCAYIFMILAFLGLPNLLPPIVAQWVQWISQTFIQLVMLSILMVGQSLLGRHQELQSDEQFATTQKTFSDAETLIAQSNRIIALLEGKVHE